jgi:hypothetical protein
LTEWATIADILVRERAYFVIQAAPMGCIPVKVAVAAIDVSVPPVINREVHINNSLRVDVGCDAGFKACHVIPP